MKETICKIIRQDKKNGGALYKHARHRLKHRKRPRGSKIAIKNRVSIEQRPETVNTKERFGDRETDTLAGENSKGAIVTMVERKTAFMMTEKLEHGKNAKQFTKTVVGMLPAYSKHVHSITGDNGTEFADREAIAKALKTNSFLRIHTHHGKRDLLKIQINLLDSIFLKKQILMTLIINKSNRYNTKSITDPEKD